MTSMQLSEHWDWKATSLCEKWDDPEMTAFAAHRVNRHNPSGRIVKPTSADMLRYAGKPTSELFLEYGNRAVTVGLNVLTARLNGTTATAPNAWDNTHCGLGVGNGSTGDAIGDTDLGGASKRYNVMEATFPTQSNGVLTFKASYGSGEAEFAWDEYGVVVNSPTSAVFAAGTSKPANYVLLNRKAPAALGTKGAGVTWALTVTATIV